MPRGTGIPHNEAARQIADVSEWTETDVLRWFERVKSMTGEYPQVWASTVLDFKEFRIVANEPFRRPYEKLGEILRLGIPCNEEYSKPKETTKMKAPNPDRSEFYERFAEELTEARRHAVERNPKFKGGPSELTAHSIKEYLDRVLGVVHDHSHGRITASWSVQYEVAEALCKTLGLLPYEVGI